MDNSASSPTVKSIRFRARVRRALWRRSLARTSLTALKWLQANTVRTTDGPAAQTLRSLAIAARQLQHRVTMSRVRAQYAQLIRICLRRGCSREDARELAQEAQLRFLEYQRSAKVRDADSLLRRIIINLSSAHFHRDRSSPFAPESIRELDMRGTLVDPAPGPERMLAAEQELDEVVSLLNAVSRRTCQIFIAQRGGYSYEEIASAFGVMPRTVEKHVATAVSALRELLPAW